MLKALGKSYEDSKPMTDIRLAHVPGAQGDNVLKGRNGVERIEEENAPSLLVSFYYLAKFEEEKANYSFRDWVMDSGAFSAHNSGKEIDLQEYIDTCLRLMESDPKLVEIFALDVIGDHEASLKNCEEMWRQGVPAIPCYHVGEPEEALLHMAEAYPKIALGGAVGFRGKSLWAQQCFARVWPKRIHGFGFGGEKDILSMPWHTVDATNWELGPCAFGNWRSFGGSLSVRGSTQNLRAEIEWYLKLERKAKQRWRREMEKLEDEGPSIRPALATQRDTQVQRFRVSLGKGTKG